MIANYLTPSPGMTYASLVLDKERNRFGDLIYTKAHGPRNAALYVCMLLLVLYGRR